MTVALPVLGLLASSELAAFARLADDAELAPTTQQRITLSRLGGVAITRLHRIEDRVVELGGELVTTVEPFLGVFDEFERRTAASDWWERLLKAFVGYGVQDDLAWLLAKPLDEVTRELVHELLADAAHATFVVETLTAAIDAAGASADRLALWGRRLVGEALRAVPALVEGHRELRELLAAALPDGEEDLQQRLFAVLTGEHSRRMARLHLTP